jgi:hypothetical protein
LLFRTRRRGRRRTISSEYRVHRSFILPSSWASTLADPAASCWDCWALPWDTWEDHQRRYRLPLSLWPRFLVVLLQQQ